MDVKPIHSLDLSDIEASAFCRFKCECEANDLLARPQDITPDDLCDGINDDVTLLHSSKLRPSIFCNEDSVTASI